MEGIHICHSIFLNFIKKINPHHSSEFDNLTECFITDANTDNDAGKVILVTSKTNKKNIKKFPFIYLELYSFLELTLVNSSSAVKYVDANSERLCSTARIRLALVGYIKLFLICIIIFIILGTCISLLCIILVFNVWLV